MKLPKKKTAKHETPDELRSRTMRAVSSKNTTPELIVQQVVKKLGYRYATNVRKLPGSPDLILTRQKKAIFVHGCFWHGHHCPRGARVPRTNQAYWTEKILRNRKRDRSNTRALRALGWKTLQVWECSMKSKAFLERKLARFLGAESKK